MFTQYKQTILKADQTIQYRFKGNLKRAVLIPILKLNTVKRMAAAASIAALLSISTLPLLKQSGNNIQTVVVNDTPSLISMPKKQNAKVERSDSAKVEVTETKSLVIKKEAAHKKAKNVQHKTNLALNINAIQPLGIKSFKTEKINAYELGLNTMMPVIIATQHSRNKKNNILPCNRRCKKKVHDYPEAQELLQVV